MKHIVVVGGGLIGARHVAVVEAHPGCRLAGLVDPNPSVLPGHDLPRFADMADISGAVDGIILATPTQFHAAQGIYAAQQRWPMLIEKPVADDLSAAQRLAQTIALSGVPSLVGHHRRYHPSVASLREVVARGDIGIPVAATLIWGMRKPDAYFDVNWRRSGGSPVLINLVHDIDLLRFVLGDIIHVSAIRGRGIRSDTRVESGAVALAFESGATGTISFADTTPSPWGFEAGTGENPHIGTTGQDMLWIMGTAGAVSFPSMTLWRGTDWSTAAVPERLDEAQNGIPPLERQLDHFLDVIDGAAPMIDVPDATRTLAVALDIEAQLASQTIGGPDARSAFA